MISLKVAPTKNNRITSRFGGRANSSGGTSFHAGTDLGAIKPGQVGDAIYAAQDGVVKFAGVNGSYGNCVIIEHTRDLFCTLYGHLDRIDVNVGRQVLAGNVIGTMGNTGISTGAHLHFEMRTVLYKNWAGSYGTISKTKCVDPEPYLTRLGASAQEIPYQEFPSTYNFEYERLILDQNQIQRHETLYGRKYRIMVFDENGNGVDVTDLHVTFDCTKTFTMDNSMSIITIYNLNALTEGKIIESGVRVTIEAGYEGAFGLIYDGDIIQVIRSRENGTDFVATIVAMDGERFLNSGFTAFTMTRGQTKRDIVEQLSNSAANPAKLGNISESYNESKYIRGKVVFGMAKEYLNQLAKTEGANFYMENGAVNLVRLKDFPTDQLIKLDPSSGLIGTPQQTDNGVNFKCLLTPRIKINSLVQIDAKYVLERQYSDGSEQGRILDKDGVYRIIEATYSGDNRGSDWYVNCTAVSQSAGDLPQILAVQLMG